jgi:hypothetical protein
VLCSPLLILNVQPATKLDIVIHFPYEALKVTTILLSRIPELNNTNTVRSTDSVHKSSVKSVCKYYVTESIAITMRTRKLIIMTSLFLQFLFYDAFGGQSSWLQTQRSRVRFPPLPDFLRSSRSGTGSTQPREDN